MIVQHETISTRDFNRLRELIATEAGIQLSADKRTMLEVRIRRRLKALNLDTYAKYCEYLFGPGAQHGELVQLIDVVTTNKTDFFREAKHFDFLVAKALPELERHYEPYRQLVFWSAGCSTGEEPYTLAMLLSEYAATHPGFRFKILATDVSTAVLEKAHQGIYSTSVVEPVPDALKRKYLMRSRDRSADRVRVVPELRQLIEFRRLNFMDTDYGLTEKVHAIFCRNVLIYFDRPTQKQILEKQLRYLIPNGYLFVGHAESLHEMNLPLRAIAPALYRRIDAV